MAIPKVTLPVAQFAQRLKQANPRYASMPDEQLVAAFLSKNSKYQGNYENSKLVSVSFEPVTAASRGQESGGSLPLQSQSDRIAAQAETHSAAPKPPAGPMQTSGPGPTVKQTVSGETTAPSKTNLTPEPAPPVPGLDSTPSAQDVRASVPSSVEQPDLRTTVVVNIEPPVTRQMVGKYEIIEQLGQGGMGTVYKAFDPGIGRTVALKLMSQQLAQDSEFLSRFLREARAAGILQHPNIVVIHELGEWQGAPFIAMEFLEGRSLGDIVKNEKDMSLERRLDIIAQVCRGLEYAHARGIVHRDIKPANVMVTQDGTAKIVDFGIARLADQKLTQTGHVLGTVTYMSPEQLQGRTLDGRSDVFAVGVMLFEVLTFVLPFAAENTGSAITNILYRQPLKLSSFLANYPGDLDAIVAKCLAKEPSDRFQTAGELADRISRVQEQMRSTQTAPTVIRSASLLESAGNQPLAPPATASTVPPTTEVAVPSVSVSAASQQAQQVATKSAALAKEWWRLASPRAKRNVATVAAVLLLYLMGINLVSIPFAILAAMALTVQVAFVRAWWKSASSRARAVAAVLVFLAISFCIVNIAKGLMWYVGFPENRLMAVPIGVLIAIIVGANAGLAKDLWKPATVKTRLVAACAMLLLLGCFIVTIMMWRSTPIGELDSGGSYEQQEFTEQAERVLGIAMTPKLAPAQEWKRVAKAPVFSLLQTTTGHDSGITSLAYANDGTLLASGDAAGVLKLWDAASGQLLRTLNSRPDIKKIAFLGGGHLLLAATPNGIDVLDVDTGQPLRTLNGRSWLAISANGSKVAAPTAGSKSMFAVWETGTWNALHTLDAQGGEITSLAFVDNDRLATASSDTAIKIWDLKTEKIKSQFVAQAMGIHELFIDVSPVNAYFGDPDIAVLGGLNTVEIWSTAGNRQNMINARPVRSFAFDGKTLATGTGDGQVRFWQLDAVKELRPLQAHTEAVSAVSVNPRTGWLATASGKTVKVWKVEECAEGMVCPH